MKGEQMRYDVIVLCAGMVGVCSALHLQMRGLKVALLDRRPAGEETSHGNAGVIERDSHVPVTIPSNIGTLAKYAANREIAMRYDPAFLPKLAPWLYRLWRLSNPEGIDVFARGVEPIRKRAADEHAKIAVEAGIQDAFRETGWLHIYSDETIESADPRLAYAKEFGVNFDVLDRQGILELEPFLSPRDDARAIFWKDAVSVSSPGRVTKQYAELFKTKGGDFVIGDARSLLREGDYWQMQCEKGAINSSRVVVALGPWSSDLLEPLGYRFPLAVKRGYHRHFRPQGNATLHRPIVDEVLGFVITPVEDGIRLTTGIEFAHRDSSKNLDQLEAALPFARKLFPLGEPVEENTWRGARPCFPDGLPIVDASGDHNGLYFNFGHGHLGFSSGPVLGRLMADMIMDQVPDIDPTPYSAKRF
jgi:D-amino-acid dehydrogenase